MFKRALVFFILLAMLGGVALNFKRILLFGQAHEIRQGAQRAIEVRNWEKAIQVYEAGIKQYPENTAIALRLAWLYQQNQQIENAQAVYQSILKIDPSHVDALMGLAKLLENLPGQTNEAIIMLRKAVKAHPEDPRLLNQIGGIYKRAADNPDEKRVDTKKWLYRQAVYYYRISLKLKPKQFLTQFNLGVAEQNLENLQLAAEAYCQAASLRPDSYEAHYNLGLVLSELNFLEESYRQMDRATKILTEKDEISTAQGLALKVQNVKNKVFNSGRRGLSSGQDPPFLDKACLTPTVVEEKSSEKQSN